MSGERIAELLDERKRLLSHSENQHLGAITGLQACEELPQDRVSGPHGHDQEGEQQPVNDQRAARQIDEAGAPAQQ